MGRIARDQRSERHRSTRRNRWSVCSYRYQLLICYLHNVKIVKNDKLDIIEPLICEIPLERGQSAITEKECSRKAKPYIILHTYCSAAGSFGGVKTHRDIMHWAWGRKIYRVLFNMRSVTNSVGKAEPRLWSHSPSQENVSRVQLFQHQGTLQHVPTAFWSCGQETAEKILFARIRLDQSTAWLFPQISSSHVGNWAYQMFLISLPYELWVELFSWLWNILNK